MDKYKDLDKQVKNGELQANEQQTAQIKSMPALKAEIDDLEALCKLYMESNPDFNKKKDEAPALGEADIAAAVTDALVLVARVCNLKSVIEEDASILGASDVQRAALDEACRVLSDMQNEASKGVPSIIGGAKRHAFADAFTNLARKSGDSIVDAVSHADLNTFVTTCYTDNAEIKQRVVEK